MRPKLENILERLLASTPAALSLDDVGDAIGVELVTQAEIEELLDALEHRGRPVVEGALDLRERLKRVLAAARQLRTVAGREPSIDGLAKATGLSSGQVRAALLYASVLAR